MGYCTEEQAAALIAHFDRQKQWDKNQMPTEQDAIEVFFKAYQRLKDFGWKEIIYHPKDGSTFQVIEPGSTGIFPCQYWEKPTRGSFWILEDGGCPSHPVLWRPLPESDSDEPV